MNALKLQFHPQAWSGDDAFDADPQGETLFYVAEPEARQLTGYEGGWDDFDADSYDGDELRRASTAPAWIQRWEGPFYIDLLGVEASPSVLTISVERWAPVYKRCTVPASTSLAECHAIASRLIAEGRWTVADEGGKAVLAEVHNPHTDEVIYDACPPIPPRIAEDLRLKLRSTQLVCLNRIKRQAWDIDQPVQLPPETDPVLRGRIEALAAIAQAIDGDTSALASLAS